MTDKQSTYEQIMALPISAGADGRDLIDRKAVLAIVDAEKTVHALTQDRHGVREEREACAAICDERARFYGLEERAQPGDRERAARMRNTSMAMKIAADMIRTRTGRPTGATTKRVLFGRELNDDNGPDQNG